MLAIRRSILVSLALAVAAIDARAQTPQDTAQAPDTVYPIEELRVEVSRLSVGGVEARRLPFFLSFQSGADVRTVAGLTVADALTRLPGVHMNDELGAPYQPDLTLRGFSVSPVVGLPQSLSVFVDGVRVNEPDAAQVHFDLIPMEDIERIEVIRGPSGPFGRNALAGAVNIVTRRGGPEPGGTLELGGGSFGRLETRAQVGGTVDEFDYYGSARYERSDGWRQVTGASVAQLYGKIGRRTDRDDAWISYFFAADSIEQAGSLPESWLAGQVPARFEGMEDFRRINFTGGDYFKPELHFVTGHYARQLGPDVLVQTTAFFRSNQIDQFNANITEADTRGLSDLWSAGAAAQISHRPNGNVLLAAGLEYARDDVEARIFAVPTGTISDSELTTHVSTEQDAAGAFGQAWWAPTERLSVMGSVRFDLVYIPFRDLLDPANDGNNTFRQLTGSVGADYLLTPRLSAYASYGRGFRAPVILELACADPEDPCPLPFELGADPPLDPVTTDTWQAGLRLVDGPRSRLELSGYWSEVHDDIFNVTAPPTTRGFFQNLDRTRRQGIELGGDWSFTDRFRVHGDVSYTRATFQTRSTLAAPFLDDDDEEGEGPEPGDPDGEQIQPDPPTVTPGDEFAMIPDLQAQLALTYEEGPWRASLEGSYVGRQWLRGDEDNTRPGQRLDPYVVLDLYGERSIGSVVVFARLENVLDTEYETFGVLASNLVGPGEGGIERFLTPGFPRRIFAGARWSF